VSQEPSLALGLDAWPLVYDAKRSALRAIRRHHYTRSVPSGKTFVFAYEDAVVCFSIPANKNARSFLLGSLRGDVWELSRLWAPDGHRDNLLTRWLGNPEDGLPESWPVPADCVSVRRPEPSGGQP
jgi:hypothetical protein